MPEARSTPARPRQPLLRQVVGGVLRRERLRQRRTLREVAAAARVSMPYLSEVERGRKEASSEVLAAVAQALGLRLLDLVGLVERDLLAALPAAVPATVPATVPALSPSAATPPSVPGYSSGQVALLAA